MNQNREGRILSFCCEQLDMGVPPHAVAKIAESVGVRNDGPLRCPACRESKEFAVTLIGTLGGGLDTANRCTCESCGHSGNVLRFRIEGAAAQSSEQVTQ